MLGCGHSWAASPIHPLLERILLDRYVQSQGPNIHATSPSRHVSEPGSAPSTRESAERLRQCRRQLADTFLNGIDARQSGLSLDGIAAPCIIAHGGRVNRHTDA